MAKNNIAVLEKNIIKTLQKQSFNVFLHEEIKNKIINCYESESYNFEKNIFFRKINSMNIKRMVANLKHDSNEFFLASHLNEIIKTKFNHKLINHHIFAEKLLNDLEKVKDINNFTLVEFDFINFYNSISSEYIYEKYLKTQTFNEKDLMLIKKYILELPYCFAGVCTSNTFAEIILKDFKLKLIDNLKNFKLLSINRYGDDFVLILNEKVDEEKIKLIIQKTILQVFFDENIEVKHQNKTKAHLSGNKFKFITNQNLPIDFDYLGYKYYLIKDENNLKIEIGISSLLKKLYKEKIKELIKTNYKNIEKLRQLIKLNTKRFVFKKQNNQFQQVQYFSVSLTQNRKLLRIYKDKINKLDKEFYQNIIFDCFFELDIKLPYYLKDKNTNSSYNPLANLLNNKATFLNSKVYSKQKLIKLNKDVFNENVENFGYHSLSNNALQHFTVNKKQIK